MDFVLLSLNFSRNRLYKLTLLDAAATSGSLILFNLMIERGAKIKKAVNLLFSAAKSGSLEMLARVVKLGVKPESPYEWSAVFAAIYNGDIAMTRALLDQFKYNVDGSIQAQQASVFVPKVVEYFHDFCFWRAFGPHVGSYFEILSCDPKTRSLSPLSFACYRNQANIAKMLIDEYGAVVDECVNGETALSVAARRHAPAAAKVLPALETRCLSSCTIDCSMQELLF